MDEFYSKNGNREWEEKLLLPYSHTLQTQGNHKNVLSKVSKAVNFWFKIPQDKLAIVESALEMLKLSIRIFNDVINDTRMRKGMPTANSIFGIPCTINAYLYMACLTEEKLRELERPEVVGIFAKHQTEMALGYASEIVWRVDRYCPTEEEYKKMAVRKYGHAILLAADLLQLLSDNKFDLTRLGEKLGLFFQIYEDYASLNVNEKDFQNMEWNDSFSEGKFSFPIVYAVHNHPEVAHINKVLRKRTNDWVLRNYCVRLLEECGSFAYTKQVLGELMEEIREEIWKFGENPYLLQLLEFVCEHLHI